MKNKIKSIIYIIFTFFIILLFLFMNSSMSLASTSLINEEKEQMQNVENIIEDNTYLEDEELNIVGEKEINEEVTKFEENKESVDKLEEPELKNVTSRRRSKC